MELSTQVVSSDSVTPLCCNACTLKASQQRRGYYGGNLVRALLLNNTSRDFLVHNSPADEPQT